MTLLLVQLLAEMLALLRLHNAADVAAAALTLVLWVVDPSAGACCRALAAGVQGWEWLLRMRATTLLPVWRAFSVFVVGSAQRDFRKHQFLECWTQSWLLWYDVHPLPFAMRAARDAARIQNPQSLPGVGPKQLLMHALPAPNSGSYCDCLWIKHLLLDFQWA